MTKVMVEEDRKRVLAILAHMSQKLAITAEASGYLSQSKFIEGYYECLMAAVRDAPGEVP